ncbi:MAG: class B sortase, partial [Clostridiales bacterium]|nr:class B sortase [Clostridiales bacterium]
LLAFGSYAIWDSGQVYSAADAVHYATYKPTTEGGDLSFQDLQAINPEDISWLTVYGTHIDYPVAQGPDNMKYVNTDAKGQYSLSGAIFLDAGCSPHFSDFNSIIYGHHMEKNTMFGEIGLFSQKAYFDAREYGSLYYDGREHGLEFFAFVHTDAYNNSVYHTRITGQGAEQAYLDLLMKTATYTRNDVPVTTDDRIVLLSTCSEDSTNGRDILIGKITDQTYADPFPTQTAGKANTIPVISALPGFWARASLTVRIMLTALPLLLILLASILIYTKRKRSRKKRAEQSCSEREV